MSTLYVVATPIGNLEDISLRALRVLKEVDFIICEDTRVTSKLLARYEIKKPLLSYFQHSRLSRLDEIAERLSRGESAALVTDAGTPGISDPGGVLIKMFTSKLPSLEVSPIPGPCAAVAALSIAGLPADKFVFMGFPPHKKGRQAFWRRVVECEETVVFYESPHRILKSLEQLRDEIRNPSQPPQILRLRSGQALRGRDNIIPPLKLRGGAGGVMRRVVVCRELTKMFESIYRGTIEKVIEKVQKDPVKGECVVIVGSK